MIGDREWEVYRVRLDEGEGLSIVREKIEEEVWKMLMGWDWKPISNSIDRTCFADVN